MSELIININGRDVPIDHVLDVYKDGLKWMAMFYGESDVEIDPFTADRIIEVKPGVVEEAIIKTRGGAHRFVEAFRNDQNGETAEMEDSMEAMKRSLE